MHTANQGPHDLRSQKVLEKLYASGEGNVNYCAVLI